MTFTGRSADGVFGVQINADSLRHVDRLCVAAGMSETGGVLIGRYSPDRSTAIVVEASPPPADSRQGATWFVRGVAGLGDVLLRRWRANEKTYYLGEWHFHPAAVVEPSDQDFREMGQIAGAPSYHCPQPILLIVAKRLQRTGRRPMRAFVCPTGDSPRELLNISKGSAGQQAD